MEDVERLNMLYVGGKDHLGRPVVVFVAKHLPPADEVKLANMERVLLYTIREMDPIVQNDFVLVYIHTEFSEAKRPEFTWLKKVYNLFNRKYKKNMKKIFIVHPTMWTKIIAWLATPFVSSKVWKKLVYVDNMATIYEYFDPRNLRLPAFVFAYDAKANPESYSAEGL